MEIIRFKITIYLVIKQNILNLVVKVEFMKMSTPQEKAQCVFWFIENKSDIQAQRNLSVMSDFVSINQKTHWAFSCGELIYMNPYNYNYLSKYTSLAKPLCSNLNSSSFVPIPAKAFEGLKGFLMYANSSSPRLRKYPLISISNFKLVTKMLSSMKLLVLKCGF